MQKLELPNITLAFLAHELNALLAHSFVQKVQELDNGWLKLKIHTQSKGDQTLVITPQAVFVSQYSLSGKPGTGFAAFASKQLYNQRLDRVSVIPMERILVMEFSNHKIYIECFATGNVILTDEHNKILLPLNQESWSSREIKRNEPYELPPSKKSFTTFTEFSTELSESTKDIVRSLVHSFGIPPQLAEHACMETHIEKTTLPQSLTLAQRKTLHARLLYYYQQALTQSIQSVLIELNQKQFLYPFPLTHIPPKTTFDSLSQALDELLVKNELLTQPIPADKKHLDLIHSMQDQQRIAIELEQDIKVHHQQGEWVYAHFTELHLLLEEFFSLQKTKKNSKEIVALLKVKYPWVQDFKPETQELILEIPEQ